MIPVVAIVGRPNVGKSTLFNRLIGERRAIVHDSSGVTRDRHYGEAFWNGVDFRVIDTGGYVPDDPDKIVASIRDQVDLAIDEADVLIFLVDVRTGIVEADRTVAQMLRLQDKPVVLAANKADNQDIALDATEFYEFGYDEVFPVSSMSGTGTGELLDEICSLFPKIEADTVDRPRYPRLAIVGRPNVGKSSLVNKLLNDERSLVSDIAGTTRDSINSVLKYYNKYYEIIDTAGLRRKTRVKESVEFYSTLRAFKAIRECDVAILLIDAVVGFESQDIRVLKEAEKFNKGIIILINKWDLVEKDTKSNELYINAVYERIPDMKYISVLTVSALTGQRVQKLMELVDRVLEERQKSIPTGKLNKFIETITQERPLPQKRGHTLSIKYGTQVKANPPVFAFFMNHPYELPANYRRFIENRLRGTFGFEGVPITMVFKEK